MKGLEKGLAFAERQGGKARVTEVYVPSVEVAEVRRKTGLSQARFARSIGVLKGTLLNWEHRRRKPTGPAQILPALIAKEPGVVQELLRQRVHEANQGAAKPRPPANREDRQLHSTD